MKYLWVAVLLILIIPAVISADDYRDYIPKIVEFVDTWSGNNYYRGYAGIEEEYMLISAYNDREIEGSISGTFTILIGDMSGHIGEKEYFYVFIETTEGVYTRKKLNISQTFICESDTLLPKYMMLKYKELKRNGKIMKWSPIAHRYLLIIPTNTIMGRYEIE